MDAKFINDYRPISLIGSVYKVVTKILANRLAVVIADIVFDTQSAFIAERQILDGPFILNEVLHWCKRKNKKTMFFKVDFAKVYDSVRWDYRIDVLEAFGFCPTWCKWIRGTFCFAKASVLVNGSPSNEFQFHRELKQGDHLSPYLFILVMESLHLSFSRAVEEWLFKGICLNVSVSISHLFYAGDPMVIGECSDANLRGIINILKCFFLASGLQINIDKSQVLGVGVPRLIVERATSSFGCSILQNQFRYLGTHSFEIGSWRLPLICYVHFKVPKGVLTEMEAIRNHFFNGADPLDKKITWDSWDKVLAAKIKRGLGVSSFYALNHAFLLKWVWRFVSQDGDGNNTRFWSNIWKGDRPLKDVFPRVFKLELDKEILVAEKVATSVDHSLRRPIRGGVEQQQRTDLALLMDYVSLSSFQDRWLIRRGVTLESTNCPLCRSCEEDIHHILFRCDVARTVLRRVCRWWDLDLQAWSSFSDWNSWFSAIRLSSKLEKEYKEDPELEEEDGDNEYESFDYDDFHLAFFDCAAALKAASGKVTKQEKTCIENQHVFIPFAIDTFGFLAPEAMELLSRVQRVMNKNVMTPRSTDVVFKRIGFAIQKGLATQLNARLPSTTIKIHISS
nr:RNA-directed DNA polymerase, eukaryota [Tanacetum cinerariifolium]